VCNPDRDNKAWLIMQDRARGLLPPAAHEWLARAAELDGRAGRLARLGDNNAATQLRCQAAMLRVRAERLLAQNVATILESSQGPSLYCEYLKERIIHNPPVHLGGYAHPVEITGEARAALLFTMTELAIRYRYPRLCRLFDELYTLWRTRQYKPGHGQLSQDELDGVSHDALYKWARRWHLLAPDGGIADWILAQVEETFHLWRAMAQRKAWILRCWPIIVSDVWGWPVLDSDQQQRAEEFVRQHPNFCALTARNRDEWQLHAKFARAVGMRIAPRVPLTHFVWVCRYQFGLERVCDIADDPRFGLPEGAARGRYTRQDVFHGIRRVLALVGLRRRRDRPGPKPGSKD
jgi:hypothetical protein